VRHFLRNAAARLHSAHKPKMVNFMDAMIRRTAIEVTGDYKDETRAGVVVPMNRADYSRR
jgi:hypothetical protein